MLVKMNSQLQILLLIETVLCFAALQDGSVIRSAPERSQTLECLLLLACSRSSTQQISYPEYGCVRLFKVPSFLFFSFLLLKTLDSLPQYRHTTSQSATVKIISKFIPVNSHRHPSLLTLTLPIYNS